MCQCVVCVSVHEEGQRGKDMPRPRHARDIGHGHVGKRQEDKHVVRLPKPPMHPFHPHLILLQAMYVMVEHRGIDIVSTGALKTLVSDWMRLCSSRGGEPYLYCSDWEQP